MAGKQAITAETVKSDLPNVLGFLQALEAGVGDAVDAHLLGLLESALANPHVAAMLADRIAAGAERLAGAKR
jgi:hypothetical protein